MRQTTDDCGITAERFMLRMSGLATDSAAAVTSNVLQMSCSVRARGVWKLIPNDSGTDWTVDDSASDAANAAANSVVRIH